MERQNEILKIRSNLNHILAVQNFIEDICDRYNMYNYLGTLSMAIVEAVENAIHHGNQNNEEKFVTIEFCWCDKGVQFTIQDEGLGFNFEQYHDLPEENGIGEGLFLMKALSNEITFLGNGNTLCLMFYVNGIDEEKSVSRALAFEKYYQVHNVTAHQGK